MTIASTVRRGDLRNIAEPSQRFARFARAISTIDKFGQAFYVLAPEYPLPLMSNPNRGSDRDRHSARYPRQTPRRPTQDRGAKWFQHAGERLL